MELVWSPSLLFNRFLLRDNVARLNENVVWYSNDFDFVNYLHSKRELFNFVSKAFCTFYFFPSLGC